MWFVCQCEGEEGRIRDCECTGPAGMKSSSPLRESEGDYRKGRKEESETKVRNGEHCPDNIMAPQV